MKPILELLYEYQDSEFTLFNRCIGLKEAIDDILDNNNLDLDCIDQYYQGVLSLPNYHEEIQSISNFGDTLLTVWEYTSSFDNLDTTTEWRVPVKCFDMDRQALEAFIIEEHAKLKREWEGRVLKSLTRQAEDIGYELKLKMGENGEYSGKP